MLFHEAGTCAMGTSIDSPCNPSGRLNALHNVWVADASVSAGNAGGRCGQSGGIHCLFGYGQNNGYLARTAGL
jgi:hypothetical protein